jgi:hypothetical protein
MYFITALLAVIVAVPALWLTGLLPDRSGGGRHPVLGTAVVAVIAFGVGLLVGIGAATTHTAAPVPDMAGTPKSGMPPLPGQGGFLGTLTTPSIKSTGAAGSSQAASSGGDIGEMAKRLAKKMESDPGNGEGWQLLARAYLEVRQHDKAAEAFAKAAALLPADAALFVDWADAYVIAHDRKWDDRARDIVKQALAADKNNLKALSLAGTEAFDRGDYKAAILHWQRMKDVAPAGSMSFKLAESNLGEARALLGKK